MPAPPLGQLLAPQMAENKTLVCRCLRVSACRAPGCSQAKRRGDRGLGSQSQGVWGAFGSLGTNAGKALVLGPNPDGWEALGFPLDSSPGGQTSLLAAFSSL